MNQPNQMTKTIKLPDNYEPMNAVKHAIVERSGYRIPLIGIPTSSTLETCDLCGDVFGLRQIELKKQFLCEKCRSAINTGPQPD